MSQTLGLGSNYLAVWVPPGETINAGIKVGIFKRILTGLRHPERLVHIPLFEAGFTKEKIQVDGNLKLLTG